ncbi:hypothetical protein [Acanthopleuribacter pedis]|uniref:Uncharacterized protein n=1 Tax=Acanthopleuribacter pedis TaxID=442870 RepID=A0A8J7QCZ8_9BACT|nr:hypothetical protein [Acanthopleuribacter pedis]MBO1323476.1 hypothetical protein [Acanthopleuribacter pedis]
MNNFNTFFADVEIDWMNLENETGLKPATLASMAGVTSSMWSQVKSGNRNLGINARFRLMLNLAKHFNFEGQSDVLISADATVTSFANQILEKYRVS